MIPQIIHYCWFGGNQLPEIAVKCIESWKKHLPDYEIKEWNESNFDMNVCCFVREACEAKKWAFVSDYARFWILYHYGGLYFDTDVEIVKSIDDIVENGPFMGCEPLEGSVRVAPGLGLGVNPGLGLGVNPGLGLYAEILEFYTKAHFKENDGEIITITVVKYVTDILRKHDWKGNGTIECIEGVSIYPPDYFCPMNYRTGELTMTENTRTIHWYSSSWFTKGQRLEKNLIQFSSKFGKAGHVLERSLTFPVRVWNKFESLGFKKTVALAFHKAGKMI